jgi:hypothetical protein
MNMLKSITSLVALAAAVSLAGCGGGSGATVGHSQQASDISTGGGSSAPVAADFIKVAQAEPCADTKNRLYLIDGKEVFWDRAGNCPDNAYTQRLYGANPQTVLCESTDTIGGPKTFCANDSMRTLFDTIQRGAGQPNLGLDASHKVEPILFLPKSGTAMSYQTIFSGASSVLEQRNVVVKDQAAFNALWAEHQGSRFNAPVPPVDFGSKMVIAVFRGMGLGCDGLGIGGVRSQDGKMLVDLERRSSGMPVCTALMIPTVQMIVVDRTDAPVEFVWHTVQTLLAGVIDSTNMSGIHDRRDVVVKDKDAWAKLWAEHVSQVRVVGDTGTSVTRPLPDVDFNTQMVIGVFLGMGGDGCTSTSISSVTSDGATITVRHSDTVPGIGIACAAYVPSPAALVTVPRSDLPVQFVREVRVITP